MLTQKQVEEIRDKLNSSNNPLFLFDNDPDGLCSFLLLWKYIQKGKGFPVRSFPDLDESYFKRAEELGADCIFILDKPVVSESFFKRAHEVNMPVVWIDHHEADKNEIPDYVEYYNPLFNKKKTNEPVTALCYQISGDRNLIWLAVAGCVSDKFYPEFYPEFREKYPELSIDSTEAFDIFYNSQIGKVARVLGFGLKDRTTNVINMIKFLMKATTPHEVLEDSPLNHSMHQRFEEIEGKYQKLLSRAIEAGRESGKVLFFQYGGDLSISSDISNQLIFKYPDKIIVVIYLTGMKANISVRGKNIRENLLKALDGLPGATGGGHDDASGGQLRISDLEVFKERFASYYS